MEGECSEKDYLLAEFDSSVRLRRGAQISSCICCSMKKNALLRMASNQGQKTIYRYAQIGPFHSVISVAMRNNIRSL